MSGNTSVPQPYLHNPKGGNPRTINPIEGGTWRHYKGGLYRAIGRGRHHETGDWFVMYQDLGTGRMYVREEIQWEEMMQVTVGGQYGVFKTEECVISKPRFQREGG